MHPYNKEKALNKLKKRLNVTSHYIREWLKETYWEELNRLNKNKPNVYNCKCSWCISNKTIREQKLKLKFESEKEEYNRSIQDSLNYINEENISNSREL